MLAKSLAESADHFLRYGNLDLDHRTLIAPRGPGDNPYLWEIGRPVDARIDGSATFVKAVLYQGDGPMAENASTVWASLTRINPAGALVPIGRRPDPRAQSRNRPHDQGQRQPDHQGALDEHRPEPDTGQPGCSAGGDGPRRGLRQMLHTGRFRPRSGQGAGGRLGAEEKRRCSLC
ncbi:MAG: hypothetical protein MZV65_32130 [Chromatiales bacterium]|nr:hypothetical protein [Chromatiales bacterium]